MHVFYFICTEFKYFFFNVLILSQIDGKEKCRYCYHFRDYILNYCKEKNTNLFPSKKNLRQGMPSGMTASDTGYCNPMSISFPFPDHSSNGGDPLALGTEGVTIQIPRDETWVLYANYSNFFPLKKWLVFWMWLLPNLCFCNSDIVSWDAAVTLWMQKVERTA